MTDFNKQQNDNEEIPTFLTTIEVKEILGFGINKTRDLINSPGFPKIKIGKSSLIPKKEFIKWVEKYTYKKYNL